MSICETCLLCGFDLMWIPSDRPDKGDYYHLFSADSNSENYKFIHRPVPVLEDPSFIDGSELSRKAFAINETFNTRGKVQPRASVAPEAVWGDLRAKEKQDVRLVSCFMKAIFAAR